MRAGVDSLSRLAFAIGQPGQPINNTEVDTFLRGALGRAPTLAEAAAIKRVTFEAHTFLVATLRQQVERGDETGPRKVTFAERTTRMAAIRTALAGVPISGELEPAHSLLDRACNIYEQNSLKYLEPCTCISRALEVSGETKTKEISLEKGMLVLKSAEEKLQCSTDSEMKLHYALVRRAISFQFAQLMSYEQHNEWETFLFEAMHRDPPPHYVRPTLSQVLQCDKAAFARLASTNTEIRQRADGTFPLGVALLALKSDPSIALYLAPLAKAVQVSAQQMRSSPYTPDKGGQYKSSGKGKSKKGKGKAGSAPPMPQELRGKYHRNAAGDPICFAFNTKDGCNHPGVKGGGRCPKGLHICMEPKCQKPHSLVDHDKSS